MEEYNKPLAQSSLMLPVLGWISAIVSLFAYPFIFGVVGVILGIFVSRDRNRAGLTLITGSMVFMISGLLLRETLLNSLRLF